MSDSIRIKPIITTDELLKKEYKFISSEEALRDVIPPQWGEDVLSGKRKVVVGLPSEVL